MMVSGMIYHANGEIVPDTTRVIRITPDLEWRTRCLWSFFPVGAYTDWIGCRLPVVDEIGMIGNCLIVVSDDGDALTDFDTVKDTVFHRAPAPTLADSGAAEY